jgi:exodeoxyribonuclease VII large subunit
MQEFFTVSGLSAAIKNTIETKFGMVQVKGEISNMSLPKSGHMYLNLKDEFAVLAAICWRQSFRKLEFKPENGLEVICIGYLTAYSMQSKYQLVIEDLKPSGIGAIMAMIEQRKKKLAAEGLFAQKKPLPAIPNMIGVITSITGAVFQDICHRIKARFGLHIIIWPVQVQGKDAAQGMSNAIKGFNDKRNKIPCPDVIIIARGGGSVEDLWPFNEEILVRAVAYSRIPIISAIGHETDTTLVDYAADLRAPTPTAAAEDATPIKDDLYNALENSMRDMHLAAKRIISDQKKQLEYLDKRFLAAKPDIKSIEYISASRSRMLNVLLFKILEKCQQQIEQIRITTRFIEDKTASFTLLSQTIAIYDYRANLRKGYVLVYKPKGKMITRASDLTVKAKICLRFYDNTKTAVISDGEFQKKKYLGKK